jgi:tritrans,polycis-undecaprenyl-diphosphate synthase [geranylgeranyl-diphosphate specific]
MGVVPKHIGIILDGNRRFAKRLMIKPWKGHEWGAGKVEKLFDWCKELKIKELTLYAFSAQNFNRPKQEFDYLMKIFFDEFDKLLKDERLMKDKVRITFVGRLWMFPKDVHMKMVELMDKTKNNDKYLVNIAMGYGGREEVMDATIKIAKQIKSGELKVEDLNEEVFSKNLYFNSEPELIIRTGGERRTSNFLIWQSHYSEWFFLEKMWPEFEKEDLVKVIEEFKSRERRFGK